MILQFFFHVDNQLVIIVFELDTYMNFFMQVDICVFAFDIMFANGEQ